MQSEDLSWLTSVSQKAATASSDFDLNPEVSLDPARSLRTAAVTIMVQQSQFGPRVLLTKRPSTMKHHPGQIAFPGGKSDPTVRDLIQTALREAQEEVGLEADQAQFLGGLKPHETVTGFLVHPHIFLVDQAFVPIPSPDEVAEAFWVPLSHLLALNKYQTQSRRWKGARRYYYTVPFGPYYIWGATARILFALAQAADEA